MERKILLGINGDGEIVFGNIELKNDNVFSMSFDYVIPVNITYDDEYLIDRVDSIIDGADKNWLYDLCVDYNCSPTELSTVILENWDVMDIIDCSLYPHAVEVDAGTYVFESMACGQCAPEALDTYVDRTCFTTLLYLWKNYHLKPLSDAANIMLRATMKTYNQIYESKSEENILKDYINYLTD